MKRVAAGAQLPTRLFEPEKRPDDRADYCLDYSRLLPGRVQISLKYYFGLRELSKKIIM